MKKFLGLWPLVLLTVIALMRFQAEAPKLVEVAVTDATPSAFKSEGGGVSEDVAEKRDDVEVSAEEEVAAGGVVSLPVESSGVLKAKHPEKAVYYDIVAFSQLDRATLTVFKGIGDVTADRILRHIEENGPFKSFEELMEVKGIGEKKLEQILEGARVFE